MSGEDPMSQTEVSSGNAWILRKDEDLNNKTTGIIEEIEAKDRQIMHLRKSEAHWKQKVIALEAENSELRSQLKMEKELREHKMNDAFKRIRQTMEQEWACLENIHSREPSSTEPGGLEQTVEPYSVEETKFTVMPDDELAGSSSSGLIISSVVGSTQSTSTFTLSSVGSPVMVDSAPSPTMLIKPNVNTVNTCETGVVGAAALCDVPFEIELIGARINVPTTDQCLPKVLTKTRRKRKRDSQAALLTCGVDEDAVDYYSGKMIFRCKCGREFDEESQRNDHVLPKIRRSIPVNLANPEINQDEPTHTGKAHSATDSFTRSPSSGDQIPPLEGPFISPSAGQHGKLREETVSPGVVLYWCMCGKYFNSSVNMNTHVWRESATRICKECGEGPFSYTRMKGHVTNCQLGKKGTTGTVSCKKCGMIFNGRSEYASHTWRMHRGTWKKRDEGAS